MPGTGNLNFTDPQLVLPFYKLALTSPCIDTGVYGGNSSAVDFEGDPRASVGKIAGSALPDIGADEYVLGGTLRRCGIPGFGYDGFVPMIASPSGTARISGSFQVDLAGAIQSVRGIPAIAAGMVLGVREDLGALPFI